MSEPIPTMIVPTLNGHKRLAYMIESIDYHVNDLLIIDNGHSDRGAYDLMCIYHNPMIHKTHTISLPSNLGVAASWNLGIKLFPWSEYWCIVNDDVVFEPGALAGFSALAEGGNNIVLANANARWCAFTIGEKVVDAVGLFPERYFPAYFEDSAMERRLLRLMPEDTIKTGPRVEHANSSTIGSDPLLAQANARTFLLNMDIFDADNDDEINWSIKTRRLHDWDQSRMADGTNGLDT